MVKVKNKYQGENPFTVPDNYFDDLEQKIMHSVVAENALEKPSWKVVLRPYWGFAAMFLIAMLVIQVIIPDSEETKGKDAVIVSTASTSDDSVYMENLFDTGFNPTDEEIIEYLSWDIDNYEWTLAGIYE